ncbi:hypothetical protein C7M61_005021 [Candidozyma pseudohaemuli]|uniref:Uncharacterized protein n=1 Tax=Candidozyma pseudohaemuli TaxID=418784 RepID=A0A2P7YFC1_9ASCO|nr:hypothetical protein C7M61_005021 [[Candida] pseudohaemulonii]PSK34661.1 hypothetical protein C7M61_005021 [[Candida] pseudohaemulonii]
MPPSLGANWRLQLPRGKRRLDFDDEPTKDKKREVKPPSKSQPNITINNTNTPSSSGSQSRQHDRAPLSKSSTSQKDQKNDGPRLGLNTEVHPLLRDLAAVPQAQGGPKKPRSIFDPASLNPYLNQTAAGALTHRPRPLSLNPQGKYVAQGDQLREKLKKEVAEEKRKNELASKNLLPDENIGEQLYKPQWPPLIESWDRPFLQKRLYDEFKGEFVYDSEEAPVSIYIQHPVPVYVNRTEVELALHLTKKEMKRKRRNERLARHKEKQDRIKLGLDPPPPPKVKLSNLMNVLTNEAIKDPTGVEMKVRQQVEERHRQHMKVNEERQLTQEQRHEKIHQRHERDLSRGVFTTVYRVDKMDSKQQYKVDINAKQMELHGMVLFNPRFNLVIVEGGEKAIKFYRRLMTSRIDWDSQPNGSPCEVVWEGQLRHLSFKKWSRMYTSSDEEATTLLARFGLSLITLGAVVGIAVWPGQKKAKQEVVDQTTKGPKPGDKDEEFDFQKIINMEYFKGVQ